MVFAASVGGALVSANCGDARSRQAVDLVAGVPREQQRAIARANFGARWPFVVDEGTLACLDRAVIARPNGVNYAVNDAAAARGFAVIAPIVRIQPSLPPTNPYPALRQDDREKVFAESTRCEQQTTSAARVTCKAAVRAAHQLSEAALAQIDAEGQERVWPPLPPRKQSLAPIVDAGLQLCSRRAPQHR
jgi:hypothetical protein